jgi:hypothetical protein
LSGARTAAAARSAGTAASTTAAATTTSRCVSHLGKGEACQSKRGQ